MVANKDSEKKKMKIICQDAAEINVASCAAFFFNPLSMKSGFL